MSTPEQARDTDGSRRSFTGTVLSRTSGARQTLPMRIADQLIEAIGRGEIRPGTRLNEAEIAQSMGTSRGPVREALRYVQDAGLIEAVPHQGSYVIEPARDELAEMVVMRSLLEGMAARIAVASSPRTLELLAGVVERMWATVDTDDLAAFRDLDWEFHETLCAGAGMASLTRMWQQLRHRIGLIMVTNTHGPDLRERVQDHADLLTGLRGATPSGAEALVRSRSLDRGFAWLGEAVPSRFVD